jgi:transposase
MPTVEDEDRKRRNRERERMLKERAAHTNRIKGLLHAQGIRDVMPLKPDFLNKLAGLRTGDGRRRNGSRRRLYASMNGFAWCTSSSPSRKPTIELNGVPPRRARRKKRSCASLNSLSRASARSAQGLVNEVFYRSFDNRRQLGSYFGLVGTPYDSGDSQREQGISKAGNRRELAVELAWLDPTSA